MERNEREMWLIGLEMTARSAERFLRDSEVLSFGIRCRLDDENARVASVQMDFKAFMECFCDEHYYTDDREEIYVIRDGIQYYAVVD